MKKLSRLLFVFSTLFIFVINVFMLPQNTLASEAQGTGGKYYCPLCEHRDTDDPLYEKERQFYKKIELLKKEYGNSIDEIVLAASVLHRYGRTEAYNTLYTENFDENEYSKNVQLVRKSFSDVELTDEEKKQVEANEKYDLLTLAAIVMDDSSKGGTYSDACFKQGLAGYRLVDNDKDSSSVFGSIRNAVICAVTKLEGSDAAVGDSDKVRDVSEKIRIANIKNVCNNGYVGGLYDGVKNITNEEQKQLVKETYAQQIIDLANFYKDLYSLDNGNKCASNTALATGDYANWKQHDSRWSNLSMGGLPNVRKYGCLVTSFAIQIARSGTQLGTLPNGYSEFNPGAFVTSLNEHNGFTDDANFKWTGYKTIAPHFGIDASKAVDIRDSASLADTISKELETGAGEGGKYQKFLILQIHYDGSDQHWVAVNGVENGVVKIFDPWANETNLDDAYDNWVVDSYTILYADDVLFGQTGTSSSGDSCGTGSSVDGLISFLGYVEGAATCNYRGQGEGTGYLASDIGDNMGYTAAFGLTYYMDYHAKEVGYTDFLADKDGASHCNSKEYIDKMMPKVISGFAEKVDAYAKAKNVTLTGVQRDALTSIAHGGGDFEEYVIDALVSNDADSDAVLAAFKKTYNPLPKFRFGLGIRRMAEYELFSTGNYNAAKPYNLFDNDAQIQAASKSTITSNWPTKRDILLYDGSTTTTDTADSSVNDKNAVCIDGKAVSGGSGKATGLGDAVVKLALAQKSESGSKFWNYIFGGGFSDGDNTPWCASFVTWVLDHATYGGKNAKDIIDVRSSGYSGAGAGGYLQYASKKNMLKYNDSCSMYTGKNGSGTYLPKAGDLIIFSWGSDWGGDPYEETGHDHIGIVQRTEGGVIYTIEGNSGNAVREREYSVSDCRVSAFVAWE